MALAFRWRGFDRVELFGRAALMAPWRAACTRDGLAVAAEWPVPDDAPSQAADRVIAARAETLAGEQPARLVIASNDRGFLPVAARLGGEVHGDPDPATLLRLVAAAISRDGWAEAAAVGTILAERFGLSLKGRLPQLAAKAGLVVARGPAGPRLGRPHGDPSPSLPH